MGDILRLNSRCGDENSTSAYVAPNPQSVEYHPADLVPPMAVANNHSLVPGGSEQRFDQEQQQQQQPESLRTTADSDSMSQDARSDFGGNQDARSDFGQECLPSTPPQPRSVVGSSPAGLSGVAVENANEGVENANEGRYDDCYFRRRDI